MIRFAREHLGKVMLVALPPTLIVVALAQLSLPAVATEEVSDQQLSQVSGAVKLNGKCNILRTQGECVVRPDCIDAMGPGGAVGLFYKERANRQAKVCGAPDDDADECFYPSPPQLPCKNQLMYGDDQCTQRELHPDPRMPSRMVPWTEPYLVNTCR